IAEDTTAHNHVTATDVDGDHLTYSLVNGPQHGTVAFNTDGTYTYTPNADYNGTDSFTYKANDGSLNSNTGTVNLTVTPVNDAPVAANASITTAEDTNVQSHVTATDVDGDHLTYSLVTGPQHGTVTFGSDGNFVYKPLGDYFGNDSFTYQASDGSLSSNVATVALTVTPVDDAPVISADTTVLDHYETLAGASTQSQTFSAQPHVQITDVDSTQMSSATIDTHGFQHGDALHVGSSSLFNVTVSQSGDDYHISIAAKAGSESTTHFQDFINSISFSSTSTHDGTRTLDYTVTDDQHAVSNTAHGAVNIQSSYEVWASQLAPSQNTLGSGDDILHLDSKLTGKFDMGSGDDTVHFEINNGTFNHQTAPNLQNVEHIDTTGYGTNTVSLSISDVLNMTDGGHFLSIVGDKADSVNLTGDNSANHWQQTGSHDGFNVYTWSDPNHAAVVEISQIMHQSAT
ncbi:MAG TPA: cadherin-like domain-containing protein, partial [Terriglobales bacterium]|nr:cadherin-like domain-containing protein [Terriglobales bacterium]